MIRKAAVIVLFIGYILICSTCAKQYAVVNSWGLYVGSITVAHDGYIYHSDYEHGIYKVNIRTGKSEKFVQTGASARSLNIYCDRLYYSESIGNVVNIYSIGLDGTDHRKECSGSLLNMIIYNGTIFFYNYDEMEYRNIYRMNMDGTGRTLLVEGIGSLSICGIYRDHLYYRVKNGGIFKTPTSHMQSQLVVDDEVNEAFMVNGRLYFTNAVKRFQCMNLDTNKTIISYDAPSVGYFIADEKFVYFHNPLDEQRVYRMTLDGKRVIKLIDDTDAVGLSIFGDKIFFLTGESYVDGHCNYQKNLMNLDGSQRRQLFME